MSNPNLSKRRRLNCSSSEEEIESVEYGSAKKERQELLKEVRNLTPAETPFNNEVVSLPSVANVQKPSYAQVTQMDTTPSMSNKSVNSKVNGGNKPSATKSSHKRKQTVLIVRSVPGSNTIESSDQLKKQLRQIIKPCESNILVKKLKPVHNNGLLIELTEESMKKSFFDNANLQSAGISVSEPKKPKPLLIVYDVEQEMTEDRFKELLLKQNRIPADEIIDMRLKYKTGKKSQQYSNWIIEVAPGLQKILLEKGRLFLDWSASRVRAYAHHIRCYKCQDFGHFAKHCRAKQSTCAHCAETGHSLAGCTAKKSAPACISCKRCCKPHAHNMKSKNCPTYLAVVAKVRSKNAL